MVSTSFLLLSVFSGVQFVSILALLLTLHNHEYYNVHQSLANETKVSQQCQQQQNVGKHSIPLGKKVDHEEEEEAPPTQFSSSVFCTGKTKKERECRFINLCYNVSSNEYLFIEDDNSHMYGLSGDGDQSVILDLSSVDDHNAKYFGYRNISLSSLYNDTGKNIQYIRGDSILFHRFNPENIMHVIHDDLIPLYHTQRKYYPLNPHNVNLIMMDGRTDPEYYYLYQLFSKSIYLSSNFTRKYVCFEEVVVGLSKTTTWYQYGFKHPQGPINIDNYPESELHYFKKEFESRLRKASGLVERSFDKEPNNSKKNIVIFSRYHTRRILNEGQLIFKLMSVFKMSVRTVDLETDKLSDVIDILSKAHVVIGVHGAHMVTSLFMKSNTLVPSTLVEIFPFGVPSQHYTPYKTLAKLSGVRYMAWENIKEENSVTHDDWPAFLGGISEFPVEKQEEIRRTKSVPLHLCCKDPVWLYRIYQDTIIDIDDFIAKLKDEIR